MTTQLIELEGSWEEILKQADKLIGHRVRVIVLSDNMVNPKHLSKFKGILPATKPYPGKDIVRTEVAENLAKQILINSDD